LYTWLKNGGFNGRNKFVLRKMDYEEYAEYETKFIFSCILHLDSEIYRVINWTYIAKLHSQ